MYRARVVGAAALCLAVAGSASAQLVDGKGVAYRPWDVQGGVSLHVSTRTDGSAANGSYEQWEPAFGGTLEVGRYWTSHFKTEVGVVFLTSHQDGGQEPVTVPTGQSGTAFISSRVQQTQFVFAATRQFGENAFVHPDVSVGARVGLLEINYDSLESVERTRVGMNPGLKVLTGVGVGIGGFFLVVLAVLVNYSD